MLLKKWKLIQLWRDSFNCSNFKLTVSRIVKTSHYILENEIKATETFQVLKKLAATKTVGKYHDCLDQILLFKSVYGNYNSRVLITIFHFWNSAN